MKKTIWIPIAIVLLVLLIPIYYSSKSDQIQGEKTKTAAPSPGMLTLPRSPEDEERHFQEWLTKQESYSTEAEALQSLPFQARFPHSDVCGQPTGIYYSKNSDQVTVFYGDRFDGIYLKARQWINTPDFQALVKESAENSKDGTLKADQTLELINVAGFSGMGVGSGYNIVFEEKTPRPGSVEWWDNGVLYTILGTGGENGTSLEDLIKMAESIYTEKSETDK